MSFAAPYLLFGLLLVPLAALGAWMRDRRREQESVSWARPAMLPNTVTRPAPRLRRFPTALLLLAVTCLLVGFARPQRVLGGVEAQPPTVVLVFDVSGSMAADDVPPTRIRVARAAAIRILHELPPRYRVAVVEFANHPRLVVAPTLDRALVRARLPTTVLPRGGTAIGDAINSAVAVIVTAAGQSQPAGLNRPGAVVAFSDGGDNAGGATPAEAAVSALVDYIPVDTVAVGTAKGIVTQSTKVEGQSFPIEVPVPLEPKVLQQLARQTGGAFFTPASFSGSGQALAKIYAPLRSYSSSARTTRSLSAETAVVGLVLALAGLAVSGLWFGRLA